MASEYSAENGNSGEKRFHFAHLVCVAREHHLDGIFRQAIPQAETSPRGIRGSVAKYPRRKGSSQSIRS